VQGGPKSAVWKPLPCCVSACYTPWPDSTLTWGGECLRLAELRQAGRGFSRFLQCVCCMQQLVSATPCEWQSRHAGGRCCKQGGSPHRLCDPELQMAMFVVSDRAGCHCVLYRLHESREPPAAPACCKLADDHGWLQTCQVSTGNAALTDSCGCRGGGWMGTRQQPGGGLCGCRPPSAQLQVSHSADGLQLA
jgi:hypothetical protein